MEISSVGFENGAVIVTIMGVKSKQYLAAKSDSTQAILHLLTYGWPQPVGRISRNVTVTQKGLHDIKPT